jgi:hypothetical protein
MALKLALASDATTEQSALGFSVERALTDQAPRPIVAAETSLAAEGVETAVSRTVPELEPATGIATAVPQRGSGD